jgi:hypothetical protein
VPPFGGGGPGGCGAGLTDPIVAIDRRVEVACAVIGGHVYRGGCMPDLVGRYLFGDLCSGVVKAITVEHGAVVDLQRYELEGTLKYLLTSFGVDGYGELYVVALSGRVYRLELVPGPPA